MRGGAVAGVRRRRIHAAFDIDANFDRRNGALAGGAVGCGKDTPDAI
jgi:hypothetical protein